MPFLCTLLPLPCTSALPSPSRHAVFDTSNPVGYQNITITRAASSTATAWSFKTVTFKDVNGATAAQYYDIMDILPKQADGSDWKSTVAAATSLSTGNLILQKISADGAYTDRIQYTSRGSITGWQTFPKSGSAVKINRGDYLLKKGEGLIIAYKKTVDCLLQVSGEVELTDTSCTIPASSSSTATSWSFGGNFTPNTIDILDVTPKQADGSDWKSTVAAATSLSTGNLILQKITADGSYTDRIQYTSRGSITGWQTFPKDSTPAHALVANEMTFAPGEGFIIAYKKTVACKLVFPSPISASEEL